MPTVSRYIILVPKDGHGRGRQHGPVNPRLCCFRGLQCPIRIYILLPRTGGFIRPYLLGCLTDLDLSLLPIIIPLPRCRHECGVHWLAGHCQIALLCQNLVEAGEQLLRGIGFDQLFPEQPNRRRIENRAIKTEDQEAHE